jgi:hypothetical protein
MANLMHKEVWFMAQCLFTKDCARSNRKWADGREERRRTRIDEGHYIAAEPSSLNTCVVNSNVALATYCTIIQESRKLFAMKRKAPAFT